MRNTAEVLLAASRLCGRSWRQLLMTAGLLLLPLAVVQALSGKLALLSPLQWREGWPGDLSSLVLGLAALFIYIITFGVVTQAVSQLDAQEEIAWRTSWTVGLRRARPVITASLSALFAAIGWALLFMLPAGAVARQIGDGHSAGAAVKWAASLALLVFIAVRMSFIACVPVLEGIGGGQAYRRNLALIAGRARQVAGPVGAVALVFALVSDLLPRVLSPALAGAADTLWQWLVMPLEVAVSMVLYRRIRAEEAAAPQTAAPAAAGTDLPDA